VLVEGAGHHCRLRRLQHHGHEPSSVGWLQEHAQHRYVLAHPVSLLSRALTIDASLHSTAPAHVRFGLHLVRRKPSLWRGGMRVVVRLLRALLRLEKLTRDSPLATKPKCMPSLRFCVAAFPNFGTNTYTVLNQCNVDVAGTFARGIPTISRLPLTFWYSLVQCKCCSVLAT